MVAATNIIRCLQIWFQLEEIDLLALFFCLFDLGLRFLGSLWIFFSVIPWGICGKKQGFHINDGSVIAATNIIRCLQVWFQRRNWSCLSRIYKWRNQDICFPDSQNQSLFMFSQTYVSQNLLPEYIILKNQPVRLFPEYMILKKNQWTLSLIPKTRKTTNWGGESDVYKTGFWKWVWETDVWETGTWKWFEHRCLEMGQENRCLGNNCLIIF